MTQRELAVVHHGVHQEVGVVLPCTASCLNPRLMEQACQAMLLSQSSWFAGSTMRLFLLCDPALLCKWDFIELFPSVHCHWKAASTVLAVMRERRESQGQAAGEGREELSLVTATATSNTQRSGARVQCVHSPRAGVSSGPAQALRGESWGTAARCEHRVSACCRPLQALSSSLDSESGR